MFTYFTDRDGKFQLAALQESGFDPPRPHLPVHAEGGVVPHVRRGVRLTRVVQRTADALRESPDADPRTLGVIDPATFQKYLNFHYSVTLDLFGAEVSTNSANWYSMGLKGRYREGRIGGRPPARFRRLPHASSGRGRRRRLRDRRGARPQRADERLRDDFIADVAIGVRKWNRILREAGVDLELSLPHRAFNRTSASSGTSTSPRPARKSAKASGAAARANGFRPRATGSTWRR